MIPIGYNKALDFASYRLYKATDNEERKVFEITLKLLLESRIFIINQEQGNLFDKTQNELRYRNLPYDSIFMDIPTISAYKVTDTEEDMQRNGWYYSGIQLVNASDKKAIVVLMIIRRLTEGELKVDNATRIAFEITENGTNYEGYNLENLEIFRNKGALDIFVKRQANIICNFLDFLNHPEIEIVELQHTAQQNQKRIQRGKRPIPIVNIIRCVGKLKEYMDSISNPDFKGYSHMFDVRGHYIHFRNKDRFKRIYALDNDAIKKEGYQKDASGMISKWIAPFRKGKGIYIKKNYEVM